MSHINRQNIDRITNKPNPSRTEGLTPDQQLNRAYQTRRDDDVIKSPQRTLYDVDFAIKSYIEETIQPQITDNGQLVPVPVIFANGEKWDNVRRLGFLRDEKGKLQSPLIMLNRKSTVERDNVKGLDVNRMPHSGFRAYKQRYNARNRYEDELFPIPQKQPAESDKIYLVDIPRYVTIEYDLMLWCDFTTQMNELVDQIMPYSRFSWGVGFNSFPATISQFSFETVNTVGEDRLVRSTTSLSVQAALLSEQEARHSTLQKMFSIKKVTFDMVVTSAIFDTTEVPQAIINNGGGTIQIDDNTYLEITPEIMNYLTQISDKQAAITNTTTATVTAQAANNPINNQPASKNEFNVYINGQYIDKPVYTWTPSFAGTQTIVFDTAILGYDLDPADVIIVSGRWA
jgi:hypothetical protein